MTYCKAIRRKKRTFQKYTLDDSNQYIWYFVTKSLAFLIYHWLLFVAGLNSKREVFLVLTANALDLYPPNFENTYISVFLIT